VGLLRRVGDVLALTEGQTFCDLVSDLRTVEYTSEEFTARTPRIYTYVAQLYRADEINQFCEVGIKLAKESTDRMHALVVFYRQVPSGEETGRRIGFVRRIGAVLVLD